MAFNGYMNKRLRINLNKKSVQEEVISEDFCQKFIGGKGFNTKILLDEVGPGIKPFSEKNLLMGLIFAGFVLFYPREIDACT